MCPSGTENIYKLYAESLRSEAHLATIISKAHDMLRCALGLEGAAL